MDARASVGVRRAKQVARLAPMQSWKPPMNSQRIAASQQPFEATALACVAVHAGIRAVRNQLRRLWEAAQAGQPLAEIDARLLHDIGLSEFAADRAATAL